MAKINISFDSTNYSIDESALAPATTQLQSHLSSTMNGSGATINLGGTACSVDSTKLSAATNIFVSHLGTVAGEGHKIVIGGVEYNVDSTKVRDAIAKIHTILNGLQNSGSANVAILDEAILDIAILE